MCVAGDQTPSLVHIRRVALSLSHTPSLSLDINQLVPQSVTLGPAVIFLYPERCSCLLNDSPTLPLLSLGSAFHTGSLLA